MKRLDDRPKKGLTVVLFHTFTKLVPTIFDRFVDKILDEQRNIEKGTYLIK